MCAPGGDRLGGALASVGKRDSLGGDARPPALGLDRGPAARRDDAAREGRQRVRARPSVGRATQQPHDGGGRGLAPARDAQPLVAAWPLSSTTVRTRSAAADGGSWAIASQAASSSHARASGPRLTARRASRGARAIVSSRLSLSCSRAQLRANDAALAFRL